MKQCPTCRTTYTDETLRFCLADGAPLNDIAGEQPTVVRQTSGGPSDEKTVAMHAGQVRVDIPQDAQREQYQAPPPASGGSGGVLKVLLAILGLGIFAALIAIIGVLIYYNSRPDKPGSNIVDLKTPAASPAPTKDTKDDLRDQIANLEKQLAERSNTNRPSNATAPAPNIPSGQMTTNVRANSPGDGFLALRTLPSATVGDRVLKIPHGAAFQIGACGPVQSSVHPGRWCQARYNGYTGYVYDYYVTY